MSNVQIMRNYLKEQDIRMEEVKNDDGSVFFRTYQTIKNGNRTLLVISFNPQETLVDLNIFDIANITDPLKKESLHKLLNEVNSGYRFTKFYESSGEIVAQYSCCANQNRLNPADILEILIILFQSVEECHPKFMKLQWA